VSDAGIYRHRYGLHELEFIRAAANPAVLSSPECRLPLSVFKSSSALLIAHVMKSMRSPVRDVERVTVLHETVRLRDPRSSSALGLPRLTDDRRRIQYPCKFLFQGSDGNLFLGRFCISRSQLGFRLALRESFDNAFVQPKAVQEIAVPILMED